MEQGQRLLKLKPAGERLGVGRTKVYQLIADGELEAVSIGRSRRIVAESIDAYVARLRKGEVAA